MKLNAIDYDKNKNLNKTDQDSCESHLIDIVILGNNSMKLLLYLTEL